MLFCVWTSLIVSCSAISSDEQHDRAQDKSKVREVRVEKGRTVSISMHYPQRVKWVFNHTPRILRVEPVQSGGGGLVRVTGQEVGTGRLTLAGERSEETVNVIVEPLSPPKPVKPGRIAGARVVHVEEGKSVAVSMLSKQPIWAVINADSFTVRVQFLPESSGKSVLVIGNRVGGSLLTLEGKDGNRELVEAIVDPGSAPDDGLMWRLPGRIGPAVSPRWWRPRLRCR